MLLVTLYICLASHQRQKECALNMSYKFHHEFANVTYMMKYVA